MHVLVTCKNEDDSIQTEGARAVTTFSHHNKSMEIFLEAQGRLTLQSLVRSRQISKLILDVMDVLVTCKNKEGDQK